LADGVVSGNRGQKIRPDALRRNRVLDTGTVAGTSTPQLNWPRLPHRPRRSTGLVEERRCV